MPPGSERSLGGGRGLAWQRRSPVRSRGRAESGGAGPATRARASGLPGWRPCDVRTDRPAGAGRAQPRWAGEGDLGDPTQLRVGGGERASTDRAGAPHPSLCRLLLSRGFPVLCNFSKGRDLPYYHPPPGAPPVGIAF